jgi:hypothetical protein
LGITTDEEKTVFIRGMALPSVVIPIHLKEFRSWPENITSHSDPGISQQAQILSDRLSAAMWHS